MAKVEPIKRHCVRCGRANKAFRNDHAQRCVDCDVKAATERKEYHESYHAARGVAIRKLIENHRDEFERLFKREKSVVGLKRSA